MDPVSALLAQFGVNLASQAVYDFTKNRLAWPHPQTVSSVAQGLSREFPQLTMEGATVIAQTVIDLFAQRGFIEVRDSHIYGKDAVWMRSAPGTTVTFGDGSTSETQRTRIQAGRGAQVKMTGGAQIRQNPDGSISFLV